MKKFGLIGFPLSHSFSKVFFTEKFKREGLTDHSYELFPLPDISGLEDLIRENPGICGLNVTIPHKIGVMYYLDQIDEAAKKIDAVNCIKVMNGRPVKDFFAGEISASPAVLHGYNTDAYGFEASLRPLLKKHHQQALILGNGGASRAVIYVLEKLGIAHLTVTRRRALAGQINYGQLSPEIMKGYSVIINTTPLGMSPHTHTFPEIPYGQLTDSHLLYDLVYNPEETQFLKKGREQGATVKNGLEMLYLQAEKSWEIWNS
jgi:shikimate dehydrogenase